MDYTELLTSGANVTSWEIVVRLVLAALFAAVVGWERERSGRAAGLRTHMMVSLGSAGFAVIALDMESILPPAAEVTMSADPVRIIAAIVGGVGFLGAGAIIQSRGEVRGLTTAASLWVTAAIGVAAGLGLYVVVASVTVIAFITLAGVRQLERRPETNAQSPSHPDSSP